MGRSALALAKKARERMIREKSSNPSLPSTRLRFLQSFVRLREGGTWQNGPRLLPLHTHMRSSRARLRMVDRIERSSSSWPREVRRWIRTFIFCSVGRERSTFRSQGIQSLSFCSNATCIECKPGFQAHGPVFPKGSSCAVWQVSCDLPRSEDATTERISVNDARRVHHPIDSG